MSTSQSQKRPLWRPNPTAIGRTPIIKFIKSVNSKRNLHLSTYADLYDWSVGIETFQYFWTEAYTFFGISPKGYNEHPGLALPDSRRRLFPPPKFFPQARLNIAEYMLRNGKDEETAVHFVREGVSGVEKVSWAKLRERTRAMRDAMVSRGVRTGDVVAAVISNSVDAMVISLAALSIGAIWSSSSCDLGASAIVERFSQVKPKIVFADDGYIYGGKLIILQDKIKEWSHRLVGGNLNSVVVIPYCSLSISTESIYCGETLDNFLASGTGRQLAFDYLPFHHPAFILFSSGTVRCCSHIKIIADTFTDGCSEVHCSFCGCE